MNAKRWVLVLAAALASWPAAARAEAPPVSVAGVVPSPAAEAPAAGKGARVRLSYRADEPCPDELAFVAAVTTQARPFQRAPRSAARVRSLEAVIRRDDDRFSGLLRVREADGATSERDVRGATCGEVFSALSLVAAITIDTGPPEPDPPPADPTEPETPGAPARRWTFATAVLGGAFFAMAKDPALGVAPALQISTPLGDRPFGLHLGAVLAASQRTSTTAGAAEFLWFGARLAASIAALSEGPFSLHPTVGIDAGFVRGRGLGLAKPREETRPWLALSTGARAELMLHPRFGVDLAGGMLVPITRDRWVFERPDLVVHQTPPLGAYLTCGLRVVLSP